MKGLKEFSEQVTELNKQLKDLEKDVANKEARKINLDTDIARLNKEKEELEAKVKDLKKTLVEELAKALAPAQGKIKDLEDRLSGEIKKTQEERGKLAIEKENYQSKSAECERAIGKNQNAAKDLALKHTEADNIKQKLLSVITTIKDALK